MRNNLKTFVLLMFTLIIWSSDFILGKYLNQYLPSIYTTTLRFFVAVIGLFIYLRIKKQWIIPTKKKLIQLCLLGICGIGIFNPLGYIALQYTSSINSVMINSLNSCMTAFLSWIIFHEKLSYKQILCIFSGVIGVYLIATKGAHLQDISFNTGDILVLINVILWSIYNLFGRSVMKDLTPLQATFYTCLFGLLFMAPFGIFERVHMQIVHVPITVGLGIFYMGLLGSCFGMVFWYRSIHDLGAVKTSMFYNLLPLLTTIQATIFLNEKLDVYHIIGGILIILGSIFILTTQRRINSIN